MYKVDGRGRIERIDAKKARTLEHYVRLRLITTVQRHLVSLRLGQGHQLEKTQDGPPFVLLHQLYNSFTSRAEGAHGDNCMESMKV